MITIRNCLFMFLICHRVITEANTQSSISRGKGQTDNKPIYISNYIPATMHVIFHLTDNLKYDLRPSAHNPSTTTTIRPTPPHKPGYYAPNAPPGPSAYFAREVMDADQFRAWRFGYLSNQFPKRNQQTDLPEDIDLFGAGPSDLLHQVNTLEDVDTIGDDDDDQIQRFTVNYEDTVNLDFLKQKRRPPTRAYVDLLSLYDLLNKESKELNLNKYNGYSDVILRELIKTSTGSASDQLNFVFTKIIEKQNTKKINILNRIKNLKKELEKPESYLNDAIKYIPALQFAS